MQKKYKIELRNKNIKLNFENEIEIRNEYLKVN